MPAGTSYTLANVVSRIQRGLGFRSDLDTEIKDAVQEAQDDLEGARTLPWFLLQEDATLSTVADTAIVALPTGFLREGEEPFRFVTDENATRFIPKKTFEDLIKSYPPAETTNNYPKAYALRKDSFQFFPVPNKVYTITYSYYKKADVLTADGDNNIWLQHVPYLLIGMAGYTIAMDLRDKEGAQKFELMKNKWQVWLSREIAARELSNQPMSVGENN